MLEYIAALVVIILGIAGWSVAGYWHMRVARLQFALWCEKEDARIWREEAQTLGDQLRAPYIAPPTVRENLVPYPLAIHSYQDRAPDPSRYLADILDTETPSPYYLGTGYGRVYRYQDSRVEEDYSI